MKNIFLAIIILAIMGGVMLFWGGGKKVEAPTIPAGETANDLNDVNKDARLISPVSNTMPVPEADSSIEEMIVTEEVKEFVVTGQNFSFSPSVITVKKGDKVKITFKNTSGFHDFVIDNYGVATKQTQSPTTEVLEFTADKIGSFEYYCSVGTHRAMGMKGTLVVN